MPGHSPKPRMAIGAMSKAPALEAQPVLPGTPSSHKAEIQLDIYPSLSRQADDMRLCCEPVSTTAFSSCPAHCKNKQRWEMMCRIWDERRVSGFSAPHTLAPPKCQHLLVPTPLHTLYYFFYSRHSRVGSRAAF